MEGESSSESKVACCGCRNWGGSDRIVGANDHFLGKEALFKKTRRFDQEVNLHFSTNGIELDPKKTGGKITHGPGVRTPISTFEKCANS